MDTMTERTVWQLARLAECADPDSQDSPGAKFLLSVEADVDERGDELDEDSAHEIADQAVPIYTHDRWAAFVDLAAYEEDVTELGEVNGDDLTRSVAGVALYMIGSRLAAALIEERQEENDEAVEDE